jgi:dihydrofolate reductase
MKPNRKIIVYIATRADGFIARVDGSFDWRGNYGMGAFFASIDTILWGRKTYDQALAMGEGGLIASFFGRWADR